MINFRESNDSTKATLKKRELSWSDKIYRHEYSKTEVGITETIGGQWRKVYTERIIS